MSAPVKPADEPTAPVRRVAWFDLTFVAGCCAIVVGLGLWSVPLAVIVAGALLVGISVASARYGNTDTTTTRSDDARTADSAAA